MKLGEVIEKLIEVKKNYGDLPVNRGEDFGFEEMFQVEDDNLIVGRIVEE